MPLGCPSRDASPGRSRHSDHHCPPQQEFCEDCGVSVEHCFLPAMCVLCCPHCSSLVLVLLPQLFSFPLFLCSVTTLCRNLIFYSCGAKGSHLPCHSPQLLRGLFLNHPYFTLQDTSLMGLCFQTDENLIKFTAIPTGIVCARHLDEEILFLKFT